MADRAPAAYLHPARERGDGAEVVTHALATRLMIENDRALGVEYVVDGKSTSGRAAKEVVLCAGAINTPQLLLLSGIGPAEELRALDIGVLHDLAGVGRNLHDHLTVRIGCKVKQPATPTALPDADRAAAIAEFLAYGRGPMANLVEAGAFVRIHDDGNGPDVQFMFLVTSGKEFTDGQKADPHAISLDVCLVKPESRGSLKLASRDPRVKPWIDPRYLTDPRDLERLLRGIELGRQIVNTSRSRDRHGMCRSRATKRRGIHDRR